MINKIHLGDCLEVMEDIPIGSVDMILADLPYQITAAKWDIIIPFDELWKHYERIIKEGGAIILTASQPFTSALVMSNLKLFKYDWTWEKTTSTGFFNAKHQPLRSHEDILVFGKGRLTYNPIKTLAPDHMIDRRKKVTDSSSKLGGIYGSTKKYVTTRKVDDGTRYPKSVQKISNPNNNLLHPTQKPLELFEYLIKTYSNENETVLDNTIGSGTTAIACMNTNRNFIGIEMDEGYYNIATNRIKNHEQQTKLF